MNSLHRKPISRRKLLKLMTAAGGGLAASFALPGKWTKPYVRAGVLPVHAQTSQPVVPTDTPVPNGIYSITSSEENPAADGSWYIDLTVNITPADSGITMYADYTWSDGTTTTGPIRLTAITTSGAANFPFFSIPGIATLFEVVYSFADTSLCTPTCTRTVTIDLSAM